MDTVELLLHPVRIRVVQAFLGDRTLTTAELREELADIPAGSLYRHIALLVDAGMLVVVAERRIRGAVERTYRLKLSAARITPADLAAMSADDHRRAFMAFLAGMIADFDRYLAGGDIDFVRDGVGYRTVPLWLDDAEFAELGAEVGQAYVSRMGNRPGHGRKLRILHNISLPSPEE